MSNATSQFIPHNLFVIGGTGNLGAQITQALLDKKAFNVKVLIRKETWTTKKDLLDTFKAAGATLVEGDISDVGFLTGAFKGSDTVVSVLGGMDLFAGGQFKIFEAVQAAGVRRFIPSEYGSNIEDENDFMVGGKVKLRRAIQSSNVEYTFIYTSAFYEFLLSPAFGFDLKANKITIPGDGNRPMSATHTADIAKFVPEILLDPSSKNRAVKVFGEVLTLTQAVKILEEESGKKFEISYISAEELKKIVQDEKLDFFTRAVAHIKHLFLTTNQAFDSADVQRYSNVKPRTIREFAKTLLSN